MLHNSLSIKTKKKHGEKAITLATDMKIINSELKIQTNEKFIYIPLNHNPSEKELDILKEQIPEYKLLSCHFTKKRKREETFIESLNNQIPKHLLKKLPHSIDFIGDITIIEVSPELNAYKNIIGKAIMKTNKKVRTVLAKAGAVHGTYRLREYNNIGGELKTETIHKEYGCQYYIDVSKVYFSQRLSYEHNRIANLVKEGETVVDMFAGVGPFSILIAKKQENVKIIAIDINPTAIEYLKRNIRFNRVEGKVYPLIGDAKKIVKKRLLASADRVIMNLPEKAIDFVDVACAAIKPIGGHVHFYTFINPLKPIEKVKKDFTRIVKMSGRKIRKILFSRFVNDIAPYKRLIVLDVSIE